MPEKKEQDMEEIIRDLRNGYNSPPETPREDMWARIQERLEPRSSGTERGWERWAPSTGVFRQRTVGWGMAAAAILILGLGIGRMTAPSPTSFPGGSSETARGSGASTTDLLRVAALDHLVRSESLLTLVQADARTGRVESGLGEWARILLAQTRLLLDAREAPDPLLNPLLEDLELVLVQLVGAANADAGGPGTMRSELNLALEGLNRNEVLPRIRAVLPGGPRRLGT